MPRILTKNEFTSFFADTVETLNEYPSVKVLGFFIDPIHGFFIACLHDREDKTYNCPYFSNFDVSRLLKDGWADSYYECSGKLEVGDFEGRISSFDPKDGDEVIEEYFYSFIKPEILNLLDKHRDELPPDLNTVGIQMLNSNINDFWYIDNELELRQCVNS